MFERGFKGPEGYTGKTLSITEGASANTALTSAKSANEAPVLVDLVATVNCHIKIVPASESAPVAAAGGTRPI